jgi:hypothetical protein
MVYLEIKAEISLTKHLEFYQTVLSFINDIQDTDGYLCFTQKNGNDFKMKISWENRNCLDRFLKTNKYKFFHGAIITLSTQNSIDIILENPEKNEKIN